MSDDNKTAGSGESNSTSSEDNKKPMLLIQNRDNIYLPCVPESVTWTLTRKGAPGKLSFQVMQDDVLDFEEGNVVQFGIGKTNLFKGFVFTKKQSKDKIVSVTAYDQLRYLKNKDVYAFVGKTAKEIICQIADDFQLNHKDKDGNEAICDTGYVIPRMRASNETLFDTMQTALDHTLIYGKVTETAKDGKTETVPKGYVLYDNFGVLTLSEIGTLDVDILIDSETAEDFDFESSIDKDTYNKINLYEDDKEAGKRERYIAQDSANMKRWGILQKCESIDSKKCANPIGKASNMLQQYNSAKKTLSVKAAFGDVRVRAGSRVFVRLFIKDPDFNLEPENENTKEKKVVRLLVESVTHHFGMNSHTMDLTLVGRGLRA